ncbi:MAG: hypothetical protein Q9160_005635 [Pyrenula sp. 1 TL-2023]
MKADYESIIGLPAILPTTCLLPLILYGLCRLALYIRSDYQSFLDLGPGGTPSTPWGWWRLKRLGLFTLPDVLEPPPVPSQLKPSKGYVDASKFPIRNGPRPTVRGIAPQRQLSQRASPKTFNVLSSHFRALASANARNLLVKTSFIEHSNIALFARPTSALYHDKKAKADPLFGREICHPHPLDSSMHLILHPSDAATVINMGWGERHPLARADWWWRFYFQGLRGKRPPVPEYMVLVYAPRDAREVEVSKKMVGAAVSWAVGGENVREP